ncbi:MAG: 3-deoxy-D-manno-octulosonic acid transferase [Acidobacteriota bacterium]|nr:3-deoxy-D-manno-octulosonic acid transferase [Acidobacteriota bacterium]
MILGYILIYFVKLKLLKRENLYLCERLGFRLPKGQNQRKSLWIHAVSVGEVLSLQNLTIEIKKRHPDWVIYFSSLTNTGMRMAKEKLFEADNIFFIPIDFQCVTRKFFKALKPKLFILAESEFWPNLLKTAREYTDGVLLINGRISTDSFKRFKRFKFLMKKVLSNIDFFLVQTEREKEGLEKIGISPEYIEVSGTLKSEISLPVLDKKSISKLKKDLSIPETKKVILAGSTRKGEEEKLLEAYAKAKEIRKDILLILAPRHLERACEVERICKKFSFNVMKRTSVYQGLQWDILILDSLGELAQFYALSDVSFIGGSLVPWGGQNLLEPAFYSKPIFFGLHMDNFAYLAEKFVNSGAAQIIYKDEELIELFLFKDENRLREMGNKAKEILNSLQGATKRTLEVIEDWMVDS